MDTSNSKTSPFAPASDVPLHRNPPLAPSQEMAYRNKCIQLKRRLTEIETNNDATRRRISTEKERIAKMRLLRAILLKQLKEIMDTPGRKLTADELKELGIVEKYETLPRDKSNDILLDDSSDESEDEDLPEPGERPTRTRRANNNYRDSIINSTSGDRPSYQSSGLPQLAPATTYSPAATREAAPQTSSFHVASTPLAIDSPPQTIGSLQYGSNSRYAQQSSPILRQQNMYDDSPANGVPRSPVPAPPRPKPPIEQFRDHMRPQLVADSYPPEQIEGRIDQEWARLSVENRGLWEARYEEQMMDYQAQMDEVNRVRRIDRTDRAERTERVEFGSSRGFTGLNSR